MSGRALREIIGDAAADCPAVSIRGDVYLLGDAVAAALSAAGFVIVPREIDTGNIPLIEALNGGGCSAVCQDKQNDGQMFITANVNCFCDCHRALSAAIRSAKGEQ